MKSKVSQYIPGKRTLSAALAITALAAFSAPKTSVAAYSGTTAKASLLNVVHVTYSDAGNTQTFEATAKTTVTVNLVKSALNPTKAPMGGDAAIGFGCGSLGSFESGSTASYLYALTATANGADDYKLSLTSPGGSNVTSVTKDFYVLDYTGAPGLPNPTSRILGSATPAGVVDDTTLSFPGGALEGFEANDIVVVNLASGGKKAFLVDGAPVVGVAATHTAGTKTNSGDASWVDGAETKGQLKLKAFPATTITLNTANDTPYGGTPAPTFTSNAPVIGEPVGEMILVKVSVKATVNVSGADGTVAYVLATSDSSTPTAGSLISLPSSGSCSAGNFLGVGLSIAKLVRNTKDASFTAASTGNPGETLEYQVTVTNNKGKANDVRVIDAVPPYTTLVVTAGKFATITDSSGTVSVSTLADSDIQPNATAGNETGFGNIVGTGIANDPIKFFIGKTSTLSTGGTVNNGASYVIKYQVKID